MTEHLPECPSKEAECEIENLDECDCDEWHSCICARLRLACGRGYGEALDAAREAVLSAVATKTMVVMQSRYEDGMGLDDEYDTGWRDGMKCALGVSLTNIDALRSKGEEKR